LRRRLARRIVAYMRPFRCHGPVAALLIALPGATLAQSQLQLTPGWGIVTDPLAQAIMPPQQPPDLAAPPIVAPLGMAPPGQPAATPDRADLASPSDPDLLDGESDSGPEMPRRTIPF
jgi:hypothetical protein